MLEYPFEHWWRHVFSVWEMKVRATTAITLSIAGSDSGGGAGIQADIKAISATGGYACTVVTALTAQNTVGVQGLFPVAPAFIRQQLDSVFSDLDVRALKIGMLGDTATIACVAQALADYAPPCVILDPVMVATSGDLLLPADAVGALKDQLLPLANLITPNLYEAQVLLGESGEEFPQSTDQLADMARRLGQLGAGAVLLKGGHGRGEFTTDIYCQQGQCRTFSSKRVPTLNTHGTGCSLSSAIASYVAQGSSLEQAVAQAKPYISQAIATADQLSVGRGHGPVNHFHALDC